MSQLKRYFSAYYWSLFVLGFYLLVAFLAPIIANDVPIACKTEGKWIFPVLSAKDRLLFKSSVTSHHHIIMPLVPFGPQGTDLKENASKSPMDGIHSNQSKHWLGTDKLGRDVAAGMVYGTKTALQIGFIAVFFAFIIGVSLGMIGAYFKDEGLKMNSLQILIFLVSLFLLLFYLMYEWKFGSISLRAILLMIAIFISINYLVYRLTLKLPKRKQFSINPDTLLLKAIEIRKSFPGIFILLALTSLFVIPSVWNIILIITLLGWTDFARYARAETLAVKNENYITAVKIIGFGHFRILFKHILPNILSSLIVVACFSVGSAIILESTLSFLGIGLPLEQVTWGKMMAEGRDMQQWWMVFFPGLALFIIILCLNTIADEWTGK